MLEYDQEVCSNVIVSTTVDQSCQEADLQTALRENDPMFCLNHESEVRLSQTNMVGGYSGKIDKKSNT